MWNVRWYDYYIQEEELRKLLPFQKINHFPGSDWYKNLILRRDNYILNNLNILVLIKINLIVWERRTIWVNTYTSYKSNFLQTMPFSLALGCYLTNRNNCGCSWGLKKLLKCLSPNRRLVVKAEGFSCLKSWKLLIRWNIWLSNSTS